MHDFWRLRLLEARSTEMSKRSINEILNEILVVNGPYNEIDTLAEFWQLRDALREARAALQQIAYENEDSHPNDSQDCDFLLKKWDSDG